MMLCISGKISNNENLREDFAIYEISTDFSDFREILDFVPDYETENR